VVACFFDSTLMLLLTDDLALAPPAPHIGESDDQHVATNQARERLTLVIDTLDDQHTNIVVPTPVLTELLTSARIDVSVTLGILNGIARIRIEGFGQRAAIECAEILRRTGRGSGPKAQAQVRPSDRRHREGCRRDYSLFRRRRREGTLLARRYRMPRGLGIAAVPDRTSIVFAPVR
jgi:hypothetical protein